MNQLSLSRNWDFRLDDQTSWRQIGVPGCWEQIGVRKDLSGPAWYRTSFTIPLEWSGKRIWLRFGAVSYHCAIFVNGQALGSHTLVADSAETAFCAYTSAAALLGVALNAGLGWWQADPIAGLVIAALAVKEGVEAFEHGEGDQDGG